MKKLVRPDGGMEKATYEAQGYAQIKGPMRMELK